MDHSLVAFALVAEEYQKSGDPIKGLAPLFRAVLAPHAGSEFNSDSFAKEFSARYGFYMPTHVAAALRERLVEAGLLHLQERRYLVAGELGNFDAEFSEQRLIEAIDVFTAWAAREVGRLGLEVAADDLESALLARLSRPEFSSVFTEQGGERSVDRIRELLGKSTRNPVINQEQVLDFLVARFVLHCQSDAPEMLDELSAISFGALIADAVAGLAVPGIANMPDPALRVVVDGPVLLDLLNLNTEEHQEYAAGLFELMRSAGFRLATFDHVVDEMRNTIRASLQAYQAGREYGPLGERLRKTTGFSTYAHHILDTLEERLEKEGVDVLRFEVFKRQDFKNYFDEDRVDSLRNALGEVHQNLDRRVRDANSVAGAIRLKRDNRRASNVFSAGTTFLTRNSALYSRVQRALSVGREEPDPRFAVVMDSQLCGVLWFSLGNVEGASKVSRKRLVANCTAVAIPQREVVEKIAKYLEALDPALADEFSVLMRDERASLCPMRITAGQPGLITEDVARKVLDSMREELVAPALEAASAESAAAESERRALLETIRVGKESVAVMQDVVANAKAAFDTDIAQVGLELEQERRRSAQIRMLVQRNVEEKRKESSKLLSSASRVERLLILIQHCFVIIFLIVLAIVGLLAEGVAVNYLIPLIVVAQLVSYSWMFKRIENWFGNNALRVTARLRSRASQAERDARELELNIQ